MTSPPARPSDGSPRRPLLSSRLDGIQIFAARQMFERAPRGAINLGLGQPDFEPPIHVRQAVNAAMNGRENGYGSLYGLPELRQACAEYVQRYHPRQEVTDRNILVTMGGSEGLMVAAGAFYDPGDEVLVPDPGFVFYDQHARVHGAVPVPYPLLAQHGFVPQVADLQERITPRTKAICVNSPANPTGAVFPREAVKAVSDLANDHGLVVITDEVYDRFVYDRPHTSFLEFAEDAVLVYSFSKTFAIPGWRVGFVAASREHIERMSILHYFTVACPSTPVQRGILAGLRGPQDFVTEMVAEFRRRRDLIVELLSGIPGVRCVRPEGALYVFPTTDVDLPDAELALRLLDAGIVCAPGSAFGRNGAGHLRFSYAASPAAIRDGMAIVRRVVEGLPPHGAPQAASP